MGRCRLGQVNVIYDLERTATGAGVGWFTCVPIDEWDLDRAINYLEDHPYDVFMHKYVLERLGNLEPEEFGRFVKDNKNSKPFLEALIYEAWSKNWKFEAAGIKLEEMNLKRLVHYTPLIDIRWGIRGHGRDNLYWLKCFASNYYRHTDLPKPDEAEALLPFDRKQLSGLLERAVHIKEIAPGVRKHEHLYRETSPKSFIKSLLKKLEQHSILTGWETRTEATLSPFAVERPWLLGIEIREGRNCYGLKGTQISYGRGLNIHQARISCLMEVVERYCAFTSIREGKPQGYVNTGSLIKSTYQEISDMGVNVVDPNDMCLEVPYDGFPLCWIRGEEIGPDGRKEIYVPAQLVFLFANFDEMSLTSGVSSTGLGAGTTQNEARLTALLEVIERDAEKVVPFFRDRCFRLEADDVKVSEMLRFLESKGIHIQFLDLTSEFGIPCYKAFICGPGGVVLKGTGAGLDGRRAVLSAMTEVPYPYPYWFGSMEPMDEGPTVFYEDLPDYSTGEIEKDLELLHTVLLSSGYKVIYVDLTKEELGVPVARAMVPGLEFMTFFDRHTPLSPRQFAHYLQHVN